MALIRERVIRQDEVEAFVTYDDAGAVYDGDTLMSGGKLTRAEWYNPQARTMRVTIVHYPLPVGTAPVIVLDETTKQKSRDFSETQINQFFTTKGYAAPPPRSELGFGVAVVRA